MHKAFRNTSIALIAIMVVAVLAANSSVGDDAGWADRFLAYTAAVNPWMISATIVWAAGEIIKATTGAVSER
jgi:hypothetical protein